MDIKAEVYRYIRENEGTSYVELENLFTRLGFNWKGNLEICSDVNENVIFWAGWNKEAIELINDLQREGLIEKVPGHYVMYILDGKTMDLPLVRGYKEYKTPHWLPVLFTAKRKSLEKTVRDTVKRKNLVQIIKEVEQEVGMYEGN